MPDLDHQQPICMALEAHSTPFNMYPKRNGVIVRLSEDRLVTVDLWECPECGARVIDRQGMGKVVERWEGNAFEAMEFRLKSLGANAAAGYPERNEVYGYAE